MFSRDKFPKAGRKIIGHTVNRQPPKVVSSLKFNLKDRRKFSNPEGPDGRHDKIRKVITGLIRHERVELNYHLGDESRGYAERLISDAIRYGDCHKETMARANYWLIDKQMVHKLFKVLAPKYKDYLVSYTRMWKAPRIYPGMYTDRCVLELRNNPYPPLDPVNTKNPLFLHNILLSQARLEFKQSEESKLVQALREEEAEAKKQKNLKASENADSSSLPNLDSLKLSDDSKEGVFCKEASEMSEVKLESDASAGGSSESVVKPEESSHRKSDGGEAEVRFDSTSDKILEESGTTKAESKQENIKIVVNEKATENGSKDKPSS